MNGDGLYRRGEFWWMTYIGPDGKRRRASTGERYHEKAKAVRTRLAGDVAAGRPVAPPGKVTLEDLRELIEADYKTKGNHSLRRLKGALKPILEFFGRRPVASISWGDTLKYRDWRNGLGRAPATINQELAALRRMCRLGVKDGKLSAVPVVETPDPKNARAGFFERDQFERVAKNLPEAYAAVARFAYCTGWRARSEVLGLRWDRVDFDVGIVRLEANTTKSGKGRIFPFDILPELEDLLKQRRAATNAVIAESGRRVPHMFHEDGRSIPYKKLLKAWKAVRCGRDRGSAPPRLPTDRRAEPQASWR